MHNPLLILGSIGLVCAVTIIVSVHGLRRSRTTRDFYVASRRVPPWMNASAVAGEYLSAASFLGVAGLIMAYGTHGLWFPVGYTAGFLSLLVFVADRCGVLAPTPFPTSCHCVFLQRSCDD